MDKPAGLHLGARCTVLWARDGRFRSTGYRRSLGEWRPGVSPGGAGGHWRALASCAPAPLAQGPGDWQVQPLPLERCGQGREQNSRFQFGGRDGAVGAVGGLQGGDKGLRVV